MFVQILAARWADRISIPELNESAEVGAWLDRLAGLDSGAVLHAMIEEPAERCQAGVCLLLQRIRRECLAGSLSAVADLGRLLQRMVVNGHGVDFAGGELAAAHAEFTIGIGRHLSAGLSAHRAYSLATLGYASHAAPLLAALSGLGVATVQRATIEDGETAEVEQALSKVIGLDPALGSELREEFSTQLLPVIQAIAVVKAGGSEPIEAVPRNRETAELLRAWARDSIADADRAMRLARLADRLNLWTVDEGPALFSVARTLLTERRWAEALQVLQELHAAAPRDVDIAGATATAYAELDRWGEGRQVLTGLLSSPPGPDDLPVLSQLCLLSRLVNDGESEHWRSRIIAIDPAADPLSGMPTQTPQRTEPVELAALVDGQLRVSEELLTRPAEEVQLHFTAALAVGSPDGEAVLAEALAAAPEQAGELRALIADYRRGADRRMAQSLLAQGESFFSNNQFDEAMECYQSSRELAPDWAQPLTYIGDVEYRRGHFHLAQAWFEEALAIWPDAQTYRFLGDAIMKGGHPHAFARRAYQRALEMDPNYRGAQQALDALGGPADDPPAISDQPRPATAPIRTLERGSEPAPGPSAVPALPLGAGESAGDALLATMRGKGELGSNASLSDDPNAFAAWLAGATIWELRRGLFESRTLGWIYRARDNDSARWAFWIDRERQLAEALPVDYGPADDGSFGIGRNRHVADALAAQAEVLVDQGKRPEAKLMLQDALRYLDAEDQQRRAAGLTGESEYDRLFAKTSPRASMMRQLAAVHRELGETAAAADLERGAHELQYARPTPEAVVEVLVNAGHGLLAEGDLDGALGCFQEALCLAEDAETIPLVPIMTVQSLNGLGRAHRRVGLGRTALGYLERALQLNTERRNVDRLSADHLTIGQVLRDFPQLEGLVGPGDARSFVETALTLASAPNEDPEDELGWVSRAGAPQRINAPERAWPALLELAAISRQEQDYAAAARWLEIAVRIADAVRAGLVEPEQRIAVQNDRIEAHLGLVQCYLALGERIPEVGAAARDSAWRAYETMRARTFLDMLGEAELAVPPHVLDLLVEKENALLNRRRELRMTVGQDQSFWTEYRQVEQGLAAVWREMVASTPNAESYVEIREARPADPADLTNELVAPDGTRAVLASLIILDAETLGVLALRADDPHPVIEQVPLQIADLTAFLRQNFGAADRVRDLAVDLEDLFHEQLAPVTTLLGRVCDPDEVLVVCPTGALHLVPLGAARIGNQILLERNPLALLPSASMIRGLRSAAHAQSEVAAAVFGDPTGDLPGGREEAVQVARRFGVDPLLGPAATHDAVLTGLGQARIVHVSAHAKFDVGDPMASGVRLADGVLSAREIIGRQAPGLRMVALSACETGISHTDQAEELLGLTRALLFTGADSVVVSLWKVPDRPTKMIMEEFYAGLSYTSNVRALQAATLSAREEYGVARFDRWAGFQLMGEWR